MEIGAQIKRLRASRKLSQDELAEKIFVSRQTISNWEHDKNYPDVKSLLLLSSLLDVSLDLLLKGDLVTMKEKIKAEDIAAFHRNGTIFGLLLLSMIVLPVPLVAFGGSWGVGLLVVLCGVTIYAAVRIEQQKKRFHIQTYKEILAFSEGKALSEIEKNREYGKRPYQKFLLAMGAGLLTIVIAMILMALFFVKFT